MNDSAAHMDFRDSLATRTIPSEVKGEKYFTENEATIKPRPWSPKLISSDSFMTAEIFPAFNVSAIKPSSKTISKRSHLFLKRTMGCQGKEKKSEESKNVWRGCGRDGSLVWDGGDGGWKWDKQNSM
jgi:hypothetical protein